MKGSHYNAYLVKGGITVGCLGHSEIPEKKTKAERGKEKRIVKLKQGLQLLTQSVDSCQATSKSASQKEPFLVTEVKIEK